MSLILYVVTTDAGDTANSPFWLHMLLGFLVILVWPVLVAVYRGSVPANALDIKQHRRFLLITGIVTAALYSDINIMIFDTKEVAGYNYEGEAGWLDHVHSYESVYQGEWLALWFLYLLPAFFFLARWLLLDKPDQETLLQLFLYKYPVIIVSAYLAWYVCIVAFDINLGRDTVIGNPS